MRLCSAPPPDIPDGEGEEAGDNVLGHHFLLRPAFEPLPQLMRRNAADAVDHGNIEDQPRAFVQPPVGAINLNAMAMAVEQQPAAARRQPNEQAFIEAHAGAIAPRAIPLPVRPGQAGAANNLARARQQHQREQRNQRRRIADGAAEGVGDRIYIDEVEAEALRRPRNRDNIEAIDGMNNAMIDATRMISEAISRQAVFVQQQPPPAPVVAQPNFAPPPPPVDDAGVLIESLYRRLASARVANREEAVLRYERMIDRLEMREEAELQQRINGDD